MSHNIKAMDWSDELFKESRMSIEREVETAPAKKVSLDELSKMTGFPVEMIEKELFVGRTEDEEISLETLRAAMLNFIDSTLLDEKAVK
jgi:predicted HTH domain antitoxin